MKLYYYSDGSKILVNSCGDDFLATPQEALAMEAELLFCWHKEAAQHLLGAWKHLGVQVVESTLKEFGNKGGVFAQGAKFYERQILDDAERNSDAISLGQGRG